MSFVVGHVPWNKAKTGVYGQGHGHGQKNKIQCHHIDCDTKNNNLTNLITLCASCHVKTGFGNRLAWSEYYARKMTRSAGFNVS